MCPDSPNIRFDTTSHTDVHQVLAVLEHAAASETSPAGDAGQMASQTIFVVLEQLEKWNQDTASFAASKSSQAPSEVWLILGLWGVVGISCSSCVISNKYVYVYA